MLTISDVLMPNEYNWNNIVNTRLSDEMYQKKEEGIINNSYEIENELMGYIEMGNLKGLYSFLKHPKRINSGILANDSLRHAKNLFICAITLVTRAAIRGGLSPQIAFQLSDIYIQLAEQLKDIESINSLLIQAMLEYTSRVASSSMPVSNDGTLNKIIEYVRINTNKNITVSDIAKNFGFSRSYLSHKFKKAFGIELKAFIMQCKLEEAKFLLKYSNKSISEISSYLCFSNQSHFQRAFKKQYGITPYNYRRTAQLKSQV
jgi:AraC-like DNA-binding protein